MPVLSKPQSRALASLALLREERGDQWFKRWDMGWKARRDCNSFPVKTLRSLQAEGFVETDSEAAVQLIESGRCTCNCDRWRITEKGIAHVASLNVNIPKHEPPPGPLGFDPPTDGCEPYTEWSPEDDK